MERYSVAVLLFVLLAGFRSAESGCVDFNKCCRGQDSSCQAYGPRVLRSNATTCFCDEHCHKAGDCCDDIQTACPPQDCELGEYGEWGECSETCGWGHMKRSRPVIREGINGGTVCEQTEQKTYCMGDKCKGKRQSGGRRELRETAKVVLARFGEYRESKLYNPFTDIRKNLFYHYKKNQQIMRPRYCAKFRVEESRRACSNTPYGAIMQEGDTICVECQPSAMKKHLGVRCKGQGVYLTETRWNAVTVPNCHGKWTLISKPQDDCSCDVNSLESFVFI